MEIAAALRSVEAHRHVPCYSPTILTREGQTTPAQTPDALRHAAAVRAALTVLGVFYAADLDRLLAYDSLLERTTSWAWGMTGFAVLFVVLSRGVSGPAFAAVGVADVVLLLNDARVFREREAVARRVRFLNARLIGAEATDPSSALHDLRALSKPTLLQAVASRFRSHYALLFIVVGVAWWARTHW